MASPKHKQRTVQQTVGEINRAYINDDDLTVSVSSFNSEKTAHQFENVTTLLTLFRFASSADITLLTLGILAAVGTGICAPFYAIHLSYTTKKLIDRGLEHSFIKTLLCPGDANSQEEIDQLSDYESMVKEMSSHVIAIVIVAIIHFFMSFLFVWCFSLAAENLVSRIKCFLFNSVIRQEVAWHDVQKPENFMRIFTEDLKSMQEAIGEKLGSFVSAISNYIACVLCALVYGWNFALVMITVAPIVSLIIGWVTRIQTDFSGKEQKALVECNGVAQEALALIKTVAAFDGQEVETNRYIRSVELATKTAIKKGFVTAAISAVNQAYPFLLFASGFCYGTWQLGEVCFGEGYTVLDILIVFFCVLHSSMRIGTIVPYFKEFTLASKGARSVFEVINTKPKIDSSSLKGLIPNQIIGKVSFQDVIFNYPAQPDVHVLQGITFNAFPSQILAIVGPPGSGKSTIFQLLQRFYDPQQGNITIDANRLQDYNVKWLRAQIGVVDQDPYLFKGTIADNIRYGKLDATTEQIEQSARDGGAYEFIQQLPCKFDAIIGEGGVNLSEAQKKRIAIARALVRNPKILLLEECLQDNQDEFQHVLNEARRDRTVIVVAHRLPTIRKADHVIVIENGLVVEQGRHRRLITERGPYYKFIMSLKRISVASEVVDEMTDLKNSKQRSYATGTLRVPEEPKISRKLSIASSLVLGDDGAVNANEKKERAIGVMKLLRLTKPEACYLITGVLASVFVGLNVLVSAMLFSDMLTAFIPRLGENSIKVTQELVKSYCLLYLLCGFVFSLAAFVQSSFFTITSEWLTSRLRIAMFQAIMSKDMSWFDKEENKAEELCFRLSTDASGIQKVLGLKLGLVCQAISTFFSCIFVAFYHNWTLGFVALSFIPLMIISFILQSKLLASHKLNVEPESLASDTINHIRTVISLGRENLFLTHYTDSLKRSRMANVCRFWKYGLIYAFTNSWPMIACATILYYGATLVAYGLAFESVIKIAHSVTNGMQFVICSLERSPNLRDAKKAAHRVTRLITKDRKLQVVANKKIFDLEGRIEFDSVKFRYPGHPEIEALKGLSFNVDPGKTLALVGSNRSGKTTCFQLLMQFYDPDSGAIKVDGSDSRLFDAKELRSKMGLTSQETSLFNRSIRENIAYGDNSRMVLIDEIIEAARRANIHSFIQSLPCGYDTNIEDISEQLTSGKRQLICLARILVRNPKILMLDEAGCDSELERVVQAALESAREGRTCLVIAHRLSSIRNADWIVVLKNGKVREQGTHEQLVVLQGIYYKLCVAQGLATDYTARE